MAYATTTDVQSRMTRTMDSEEIAVCETLLEDAAVLIDAYKSSAKDDVKKIVSCRMIIRAIGDGESSLGVPVGASQGSMSALGYSQSWTIGGGGAGELYLSKTEKQMLGGGNAVGSYSPLEEFAAEDVL